MRNTRGTPPIIVSALLRNIEAIHHFESTLVQAVPSITVVDRLISHSAQSSGWADCSARTDAPSLLCRWTSGRIPSAWPDGMPGC